MSTEAETGKIQAHYQTSAHQNSPTNKNQINGNKSFLPKRRNWKGIRLVRRHRLEEFKNKIQ